jgi:CDP-diacylglycerol--glycerol-3-phosphate 3-phosphatidyltransferase
MGEPPAVQPSLSAGRPADRSAGQRPDRSAGPSADLAAGQRAGPSADLAAGQRAGLSAGPSADLAAGWSALHGGLPPTGVVGWWLRLVRPVAAALRGVRPLALTVAGLLLGWLAVWPAAAGWPALGALLIVVAACCDALDGAVAVLAGRASAFGAVADAVADRLTEVAYALALWSAGAPAWACGAACGLGLLHEYARERAGRPVAVTVNERPTRVLFAAFGLLGAAVVPASARWVPLCWVAVAALGLGQLLRALARGGATARRPPR